MNVDGRPGLDVGADLGQGPGPAVGQSRRGAGGAVLLLGGVLLIGGCDPPAPRRPGDDSVTVGGEKGGAMQTVKEAATAVPGQQASGRDGVSRSPKQHRSNNVYRQLRERGYDVFAVNPNTQEVEEIGHPDLKSIPGGVAAVVIGTRPEIAEDTMHECAELGMQARVDASGPRRRQRLGGRHRLRPAARHHRDRRRLSAHVRATADFGHKIMRFVYAGKVPKQV